MISESLSVLVFYLLLNLGFNDGLSIYNAIKFDKYIINNFPEHKKVGFFVFSTLFTFQDDITEKFFVLLN